MLKLTLDIEDEYPYALLGINSPVRDYRICWNVNKELGICLRREEDICVVSKSNENAYHPVFTYSDENLQLKYRLIKNKKGSSLFLPEVKGADYLLIIDENPEVNIQDLLQKIRRIRQIQLAFEIGICELKNKQNILLAA